MTELWLIRHGQTDWNLENRWQGQSPAAPTLNAAGRDQAVAVANELAQNAGRFSALYSSDLARARDTAETIGARLGIRPRLEPRLREINQGVWEGLRAIDIARQYPEAWLASRATDALYARAPGGESAADAGERFLAAVGDIAAAHAGQAVVIISHGFVLGAFFAHLRGLGFDRAREHIPENGQPGIVAWESREIRALRLSDTASY